MSEDTPDPITRLAPRRVRIERFGIELGPLLHLHEERARLATPHFEHITVIPRGATLGAEIRDVELHGELSDAVVAEIRQAWLDYKVVYFRDQPLSAADHVGFARRFGALETHPFLAGSPEHPELVRFTKGVEAGGFENGWHHDVTWRECPSMGALLRSVEVPTTGGDTLFCDMAAAYDGLDDEVKRRIDGRRAVHDYSLAFGSFVEESRREELRAQYPMVEHPVVRTHPETGRKVLFVNAYFTSHIVGMDPDESTELLVHLIGQASIAEYQYRLAWEADQLTFWDNRVVQHYAASDYYPDVRVMERASIIGDRPV